ncbi:MAG: hypothetical protein JWN79_2104 [Gemmatimonadetes bacterium]|jgi:hypothetical protein|nr:hypothetical protein [Gemmatimonadota bacterium]
MDVLANDVAIAAIFALSGWMLKIWLGHREKMKGLSLTQQGLASSDQRLARVEQAIESIAIEVERISEGQRFITKILSDGAQPLLEMVPSPSRRADAPH